MSLNTKEDKDVIGADAVKKPPELTPLSYSARKIYSEGKALDPPGIKTELEPKDLHYFPAIKGGTGEGDSGRQAHKFWDCIIHDSPGSGGSDMFDWWVKALLHHPGIDKSPGLLIARVDCTNWHTQLIQVHSYIGAETDGNSSDDKKNPLAYKTGLSKDREARLEKDKRSGSGDANNKLSLISAIDTLGRAENREKLVDTLLELNSWMEGNVEGVPLVLALKNFSALKRRKDYLDDFGHAMRSLRDFGGIEQLSLLLHTDEFSFFAELKLSGFLNLCTVYQAAPLDKADISAKAEQQQSVSTALAEKLCRLCGGDPALATELLQRLPEEVSLDDDTRLARAEAAVQASPPRDTAEQKRRLLRHFDAAKDDLSLAEQASRLASFAAGYKIPAASNESVSEQDGDLPPPPAEDHELYLMGWLALAGNQWGIRSALHMHFAREVIEQLRLEEKIQ